VFRIAFVSSNEEKYREIQGALLSCQVEIERLALDVPEIQALDPVEVASFKARRAYEQLGTGPVLVEDTGLGIVAWNGFPGALITWVLKTVGEPGLCRQLDAWDDRRAIATVALCLFDGEQIHTFTGQTTGVITASHSCGRGHSNSSPPRGMLPAASAIRHPNQVRYLTFDIIGQPVITVGSFGAGIAKKPFHGRHICSRA